MPHPNNVNDRMAAPTDNVYRYRAAGGVVFDADGRVLVLLRPSRNEVRLPKGHVEEGESDDQAAVREVGEETGYVDVAVDADLGVTRSDFVVPKGVKHAGRHVIRDEHYYRMHLLSDRQVERGEDEQKFTPTWMTADDAVEAMTFDTERAWLQHAIDAR